MKMKIILSLINLASILLFTTASLCAQTLKIGDPAPILKVEGWLRDEPGNPLEKGQVHVIEFWATWCHPCLAGIPHLNEIASKYADQGLEVYGVSVFERKEATLDSLRRFMETPIGQSMEYSVAADGASNFMKVNWLDAMGQRAIPYAVVVDRENRIAWKGHPKELDKVLPDVLLDNWNLQLTRELADREEKLKRFDANEVVLLLNPYMGKDYQGGLKVLDSLLVDEPELLYYPKFGHFMTYCLIGAESERAKSYIRSWWNANSEPSWKTVSDAIYSFSQRNPQVLTGELYLLGVEALQAQLENYPWSMDFNKTYNEMAEYYEKAGEPEKATDMRSKATSL